MHPADIIFFWARSIPEQPALIQPDMVLTYRELAEAVVAISERIAQYGFAKDEPVAVAIDQPIQKLAVSLALMRCGITVAPVGPSALPHLRANDIWNVIFTGDGLVLSGGRNVRFENSWLMRGAKPPADRLVGTASLAGQAKTVFFTSRETAGLKKTVVPSGALMARVGLLPLTGEANYDRVLIAPSLNVSSGFLRAAVNLYAGRTACFGPDNAAQLLAMNTFNIDALACTPNEAVELVDFVAKNPTQAVDTLREIWIEDGYVSRNLGARIQAHLCRNVIASYGSATSGRIALANLDRLTELPNAVGFVAPHTEVEIVDDKGARLQPGERGQLRCRTEFYSELCAADAEQAAAVAPWWSSGAVGWLRADDMLFVEHEPR